MVNALADSTVDVITLKSDIAVSSTLIVKRAVTLDIYGYMLEMTGSGSVIKVADGGHLTLEDSDPKALYRFTPDANGLWKWVASGGTLTAIGGESYDTEDPNDVTESFSEGIDIYRGNVTISGSGKLLAENVSDMAGGDLSFGLWISFGNLHVWQRRSRTPSPRSNTGTRTTTRSTRRSIRQMR